MTVSVTLFNALGRIAPEIETDIRAGIDEGIAALRGHTAVEDVGIAVLPSIFVARETGFGGMALGPENCAIYADPTNLNLAVRTREKAASMTVHEVHHVLRMKILDIQRAEDWFAGEVLTLEGLATQSEIFLGYPEPGTVKGIGFDDVAAMLADVDPIIDDGGADWQWINQPNGLPDRVYRAAYPMGHQVVGRYLERTGQDPITAIGESWREIWTVGMAS